MLDIKEIRENPEKIKKIIIDRRRGDGSVVDSILELDIKYLHILKEVEVKRGLRNNLSSAVSKVTDDSERKKLIDEASQIKADVKALEDKLNDLGTQLSEKLNQVPNLVSEFTPIGADDSENVVIRRYKEPKKFSFKPKDHVELGELLDIIDIERAGKISGSRFYYLKNEAALLEFALIQFCMQTLTSPQIVKEVAERVGNKNHKPFTAIIPPVLIKPEVFAKMDRLEPKEERYYIQSDDQYLIGSAEHTMGPMFMDETLTLEQMPIRYIGFSTAFRREAGSYGKDVRGILRVHQFDKLEMETFSSAEDGQAEQNLLVGMQEYMMQKLDIPHEVMEVCTGDMGKPDFRQLDINCYIPSQEKYRETHSSDYMTDFQSRRLNTTYKDANGNRRYVYMNDATAIAIGRTLIAILENYQQEDGTVLVPEVLWPYTGFKKIEPKR